MRPGRPTADQVALALAYAASLVILAATFMPLIPVVLAAGVALVPLLRARVASARQQTHAAVTAIRAELGLPADRCRVVDVSLRESLAAALYPSRRLPRFEDVHRVDPRAEVR